MNSENRRIKAKSLHFYVELKACVKKKLVIFNGIRFFPNMLDFYEFLVDLFREDC